MNMVKPEESHRENGTIIGKPRENPYEFNGRSPGSENGLVPYYHMFGHILWGASLIPEMAIDHRGLNHQNGT